MNSIDRLQEQLARMRRAIEAPGERAGQSVANSSWCVAAHLDHTIKVAHSILTVLDKPDPPAQPRGLNLIGRAVLAIGWIPRGRGKSPERMQGIQASGEELRAELASLETVLARVAKSGPVSQRPIVRHPLFGGLTHTQSLRFVVIHTEHHLKILGLPRQ